MFRKLWDMLHPKEEKRVFGLTDVEVRALKDLRATDEWQVFLKVLDMQSTMEGEGMLATMDATQMWLSKGRILGLRRAGFLIDEILLKETETQKDNERRRYSAEHATDHVKSALYGTPAW
jgi:hypothetical protein